MDKNEVFKSITFERLDKNLNQILSETPITPHVLFEGILPVLNGGRTASIVYPDQLNWANGNCVNSDVFENLLKEYGGLKMGMLPDLTIMIGGLPERSARFILYKDDKIGETLDEMKNGYNTFGFGLKLGSYDREKYFGFLKQEGMLVGIPECCAEAFISSRRTHFISGMNIDGPEKLLYNKLNEMYSDVNELDKMDENDMLLFWANEVYPCSFDCQNARSAGRKVLDSFGNDMLKKVYMGSVMLLNAMVAHSPREVYNMKAATPLEKYDAWNGVILGKLLEAHSDAAKQD